MAEQDIKPCWEIEELEDEVERMVIDYSLDKDGVSQRSEKMVTEPAGFMVYFPQGHSIRVRNAADLEEMGLTNDVRLIDMNTGEPFEPPQSMSLKQHVASVTTGSPHKKQKAPTTVDERET
jgi:hypothetical protein